ncbi:MAG: hypothetical protein O8C64_15835 [Candidatus Methanoperedens sp.]|nr:hypothetical protein [Candidatus Methanoperedens sp.]
MITHAAHLLLQSVGTIGVVIFYLVLSRLSARMGEGLGLPPHYRWHYAASIIALSSIPVHLYLHQNYDMSGLADSSLDLQALYLSLLLISNIIVILVSFRYWGWLKDELIGRLKGGTPDE